VTELETESRPTSPVPELSVETVRPDPAAITPTLVFSVRVRDSSEREVYAMALTTRILLDPAGRGYREDAREALADLFGLREQFAGAIQSLVWAEVDTLVHAFAGETVFGVRVPCTYDLDVAAAKYLASLPDGVVALDLHFSGSVFYRGEGGGLQIVRVPWSCTARHRMPVATWREAVDALYANEGWIRLRRDTLARLREARAARGAPSFDALLDELLADG
jgi:hypothetical protein